MLLDKANQISEFLLYNLPKNYCGVCDLTFDAENDL